MCLDVITLVRVRNVEQISAGATLRESIYSTRIDAPNTLLKNRVRAMCIAICWPASTHEAVVDDRMGDFIEPPDGSDQRSCDEVWTNRGVAHANALNCSPPLLMTSASFCHRSISVANVLQGSELHECECSRVQPAGGRRSATRCLG